MFLTNQISKTKMFSILSFNQLFIITSIFVNMKRSYACEGKLRVLFS